MAQSTTVVSLPQMVDLALNTPEVGIVNFTVLHSLLHVIISQLNMDDIKVEFRGPDSERIQNFVASSVTTNRTLILSQYTIEGRDENVIKSPPDDIDKEKNNSQTVVLVENTKGSVGAGQFTVAVSKTHFSNLEQDVEEMKKALKELTDLPNNKAIMDAVKKGDSSPVLDMFQMINIQKRVAATEEMIEKLSTLFEDFVRGTGQESVLGSEALTQIHEMRETLVAGTAASDKASQSGSPKRDSSPEDQRGSDESVTVKSTRPSRASAVDGNLASRVTALEKAMEKLTGVRKSNVSDANIDASEVSDPAIAERTSSTKGSRVSKDITKQKYKSTSKQSVGDIVDQLQQEIQSMEDNIASLVKDIDDLKYVLNANPDAQPLEMRLKMMESKYADCMDTLNSLDGGYKRQVNVLQNRLGDLEKQFGEYLEKGHVSSEESGKMDGNITAELHKQLMSLQDDVVALTEQMQKIMEEHDIRQHSIDVLVEQIELLKTVKADREDLEDALADKADACLINRKVSFEQFDQACGDMTRSIEEALAKLSQQETLWTQALDDIQKNVGSKLDRMELNPLRDFINQKLKNLQDRFKTLTAMKKENEAAGTKSKYLRNVNCISCDKDVVMRKEMDPSLYPKPYALPPTRSMGPYLAYELDQLRKQQKCLPNAKNMNVLENALQTSKLARSPDHVCNRYCGGSHTLTTPTQRVTRLGHFLEQWGPEIAPVNDMHVRGTDGQMYKGRDDQALRQLASERPPTTHPEQKPPIQISGVVESARTASVHEVFTNPPRHSKEQQNSQDKTMKLSKFVEELPPTVNKGSMQKGSDTKRSSQNP